LCVPWAGRLCVAGIALDDQASKACGLALIAELNQPPELDPWDGLS
jgi:hypothetical protein